VLRLYVQPSGAAPIDPLADVSWHG
jgi:hypothetical protein